MINATFIKTLSPITQKRAIHIKIFSNKMTKSNRLHALEKKTEIKLQFNSKRRREILQYSKNLQNYFKE